MIQYIYTNIYKKTHKSNETANSVYFQTCSQPKYNFVLLK